MKVHIIGAGSIGGSIALRLSKRGHRVSIFDQNVVTTEMLRKKDPSIEVSSDAFTPGDLTVIALPMNSEEELLLSADFTGPAFDVASVMQPFQEIARLRKIRLISGHPMAGNVHKGAAGWDESMFDGRVFLFSPGEFATGEDLDLVLMVVSELGSSPEYLPPERHDYIVGRISQTAYFLSRTLLKLGGDFEKYSGPGYASTSRLGRQNMDMVLDMARFNGRNIASSLEEAESYLHDIRTAIEEGDLSKLEELISGY
ncbi:MAG: prephenate dehydrogenase [Mesotoga sp.]|jgi:prephenate dehydrogenase|uniref:prephenate dehydrogenase n=1 Tax=Mesotoga TaxID=1184396 RepID=UPI0002CB33C5|nr:MULTISPECIES: prephenate dehydrogenase [Mesotoga]PIJ60364.1 prephenate dehydrogenase [Mesotoga sp. H07.pep.5.3]CCU84653.1 Prephenate dehydrogenase [Mesotoga infera]HQC13913.1 prephenate dehydrogenase [Mesotoga prima]